MMPKYLKWIIFGCLYATLLMPFWVADKLLFPFITPKAVYFRILVEIAFFAYLLLIIYLPEYRPRFSKITWAVLIYLTAITLASILGVNPYRSFWSNIERGEGLLMLYHCFIFLVLLGSMMKTKKDWFRFFNVSLGVSVVISFYALFQYLDLSFISFAERSRTIATLGNPIYVAVYLLFHIFLALILLFRDPRKKLRAYYAFVAVFEFCILLNTGSRGAFLGLITAFVLVALLGAFLSRTHRLRRGFAFFLLGFLILSLSFWGLLALDQEWLEEIPGLKRVVNFSLEGASIQNRLMSWGAVFEGWQDKPIFGYGYENVNIPFNKYFNPEMYRDAGSVIWFDRAHNNYLDQMAYGGLLGLFSYLGIFAMAIMVLWQKIYKDRNLIALLLLGLLVAYGVANFFAFDCLPTLMMFFVVLAFVGFFDDGPEMSKSDSLKKQGSVNAQKREPSAFMFVILILATVFSIYFFNIRLVQANYQSSRALAYFSEGQYQKSLDYFRRALDSRTNQIFEIRQHLARNAGNAVSKNDLSRDKKTEICEFAISEIKKNIEAAPKDAYGYLFLMNLYNQCSFLNKKLSSRVLEAGQEAIELSPTRPHFYYQMGRAAANLERPEEAISYYRQAIKLNPDVLESHWRLLRVYVLLGLEDLASQEIDEMKELGFKENSVSDYRRLANIYLMAQENQKAIAIYEKMIRINSESFTMHAELASLYAKVGDNKKAEDLARKAIDLKPAMKPQIEKFIENLKQNDG